MEATTLIILMATVGVVSLTYRAAQHSVSRAAMLAVALLCTLAQGAWADNVNYIYYTVDDDTNTITKHTDGSQADPTVLTSKLISDNTEDRLYDGWYVLNTSFSYAERIVIYGDVKLILKDGCTLTAKQGIRINTDATLTIYAQSEGDGMGRLVATETHHDKAAIGGNKNWEAGRLVVHGGEIVANCNSGSKYAAGIGGGYGDGSGMKEITIYGGKVTAKGAQYGADYLSDDEISTDDSGTATVAFMGTYKKLSFDKDDPNVLFLGAGNKLYYPQSGATIGAQRAYFKLSGITAGNAGAPARTFVLNFGDGDSTTGIISIGHSPLAIDRSSDAWYAIDGRRLAGSPTQKGIYNNGKKIVIK